MDVSKRIKKLRKALNLTQTDFAIKLGMTMQGVQLWEYGKSGIKETSLRLIEQTFNVNPSWLREGVGDMFLSSGREQAFAIDTNNINYGMLGAILKGIDSFLSDRKSTMPYDKKIELMFTLYAYYSSQATKSDKVVDLKKYMEKRNVVEDISLLYGTGRA